MNNEMVLRQAIDTHKTVRFHYKSEVYYREAAPYTIFEATTDKILVYAVQTLDESKFSQGEVPREYEVALMRDIGVTKNKFLLDRGYSPERLKACKRVLYTINTLK